MATKSIGFVVDLIGDAQVRSVDGVIRVLGIGDKINEGDILTTGLNTRIVLEFYDGHTLQVGESNALLLDESVFASLNAYPDDRVDELAQLQSLIVEGIDLAELEATAAGAAADSADGLHQASIYSRDGNEGIVETRVTPFNVSASAPDNQTVLDDPRIFYSEDSASTTTVVPAATTTNNDRPVAVDDAITAIEDTPFISLIELDANDIDLDGDTLSVVAGTFATTQGGSITIAADGSYTYTPALNFNGNDSVDYTVTDGSMTDVATLNITVNAANDAPVAVDDAITAIEDTQFTSTIDLDFNDTDLDGDALTVVAGTFATTQGGSITIAADGSYTYTPATNFNGSDSVDYTVTDGSMTDVGTLSINVSAVNNAPDAIDDAGALDGVEDSTSTSLNATMLSNDSDLDGDTISIIEINGTILSGAVQSISVTNGTVNIDAGGNITFTANPNYNGPVGFNYTISDGTLTDTATISGNISAVNDQPVASDVAINALEDGASVNGNFTVTDTDVTDAHTFAITSAPAEGSVVNNNDGTFTFDPGSDFQDLADGEIRDVTFTYTATDDSGTANDTSVAQTVTVTVTGTNDQPVASDVAINAVEDGATVNGNFTVTDADTTDTHTFAITSAPAEGSVVNNNDGTFTFDPGADFQDLADGETRDVTFTYTATDDSGTANDTSVAQTVTVTVTGTNDQPVAGNVAINAVEDGATVNGNFTVTDADITDTHTFAITSAPAEGSVVNNNDGTFTYDPGSDFQDLADGETRDVTFTYTATDDSGTANDTSVAQTVTVTVTGTNDQPVASDVAINAVEDGATVNGSFTVTDADTTDTHTFAITSAPAEGSVVNNNDGTFTFDPGADFQDLADGETRDVTFTYTATDDSGTANDTSVAQTVTVTVTGTNDQPVAGNVAINAVEDGATVNGNFTVTDADTTDTHTFAITSAPSEGSVVNNNDGSFTFDPGSDFQDLADGETRDVTFTYTATDDSGAANDTSVAQTVTVTVTGTNDQPVAGNVAINSVEDGTTVNGSFTVTDADTTDTHTFAITSTPSEGSVVNNNDGSFTFDPGSDFQDLADGETRDVTFTYTAIDDSGAANDTSVAQTVTVTVTGTNDQPVAGNVAINSVEDGTTVNGSFTVTDADTTDTHTFAITSTPAEGSVVNNNDGTFTFDPGSDFQDLADGETRDVTFTYTAIDDSGAANDTSVAQTVTVTVTGTNDQPVAGNVAINSVEDGASVNGSFTVTDADTTDTHTFAITSTPSEGSVVNNNDGSFTFDPGSDFQDLADGETRDVTFTYTAIDDSGTANDTSVAQTVTVTVTGTNDQPVAGNVAINSVEDGTTVNGSFTVTDADTTDTHTFAITSTPAEGSVVNNNDGTFTFDPGSDFQDLADGETRDVTFTYTAIDDSGTANDTSVAQTVTVTVTGTNDQPVATDSNNAIAEDSINVALNLPLPTDIDVTDILTVTITGLPDGLLGTATLADGSALAVNQVLTLTEFQGIEFDTVLNATGATTLTYEVDDGSGTANATDNAVATINIGGSNDTPIAVENSYAVTEDIILSGNVITDDTGSGIDSDPDGDPLSVSAVDGVPANVGAPVALLSGATLTLQTNGDFVYDPSTSASFNALALGETAIEAFTYTITDGNGSFDVATVTLTVTGTNDQPVASNVAIAALEDGASVNGNFTVADADVTDAHTFAITSTPAEGSVVNNNDGTFTFDPGSDFQDLADGETRDVTFNYTAIDDSGAANDTSVAQTVTVTVTGTNDQPVAGNVAITALEDGASVNGNFTVADADVTDAHTFAITSAPAEGSVVNNNDGTFTFDPGSDFQDLADGETRDVTFNYTAIDDSGAANDTSVAQTVTVTVTGTNDQPVASDVAINALEDGASVNSNFTVADTDVTDAHTFAITSAPAEGSVVNNNDGSFTFDPGADFQDLADGETRDVTFTYTATDDSGAANDTSVAQTVTVTVTGTNDQPVAGNVAINAVEDGATVLGNFTVTDADTTDTHTFAITSTPAEGSVVNNNDGSFTFDPGADFQDLADGETRDVTFTYTATDDSGAANDTSIAQTVTVTVTGTNDQPVAGNVAINAVEDGATVLGNFTVTDTDVTDAHTFAITSTPSEGSVINNNDGSFTFDPGSDFQDLADGETRDVTFTYTATDDSGAANDTSVAQTVTVTVTGTNDQPVAGNVAINSVEDGATVNGNFTVTDADTTDTHTFAITSAPAEGSVVNNNDGSFTFDPGSDFQDLADGETRDVTFTYTATDDSGAANDTSVAQTVTVTVTGTNDQPVAGNVAINSVEDGASVNGNFTVTDADTTDTHTFAITSAPAEGSVINNNDGTFTFDPGADFQDLADGETRDVTFTYTATDDSGAANDTSIAQTVTVTVTGTNDQPVASDVAINALEDGATVLGNFTVTDADTTDTHTFAITSTPAEGSVVNNNDGSFTFDPGADFQNLADGETRDVTFTYTATDDSGAANDTSVAQTVTVTVTGTNDQPVASDVAINALEDGASVNGNFTVADTDVTDTHTFAITSTPSEGSVINNNDGSFTFDPGSDFQDLADGETRDVTFTYTATDDSGAANDTSVAQTVTVTVTGTNDQPVAGNVAINSVEDGATVNGNFAVTDADTTDTHTFAITSAPAEGSVVNNNDGTFTFDPGSDFQDLADGETRDVTFTYTATDDSGAANDTSVAQSVTVTVTGTNDQPVAGNVAINAVEDGATVNGSFTVTDADTTDTHTFTITSAPAEGSVINNNDGTFTFDPGADFQDLADGETRDVTFNYTAIDDSGAANDTSVAQTVTVTVTGTNDQPVASDVAINALEDGASVNSNFTVADTDVTDAHTFAITSAPAEGSVVNNNDGSFTFDPGSDFQDLADGETRDVTFTYTATDDSGAANDTSIAQMVTVTVTGTNDQPVAGNVAINAVEDGATVLGNFTVTDADTTDTHTFAITSTPAEGSVVNNNDGSFTFDPGADFQDLADGETRDVTFTYTATDDSGAANDTSIAQTVTVTVTGTNDQPVAGNVAINAVEDGATVLGNFTVTDTDVTDAHTFAITSTPSEGSVINNNDGSFTFDPGSDFQDLADGETRDVTFTYTATDDSGAANDTSVAQTVTVTVTGTNDQPVAGNVAINSVEDGATVNGNFTVTDADTTDTHTFAITSAPAEGSVVNNNDGSFTFDPGSDFQDLADGETRDVTFTYTATDDSGAANDTSVAQTVTVTVTGTNDQPVAGNVAINSVEDGATVNGNFTVADADVTDAHTFAITSAPAEGSVVNNNDGSFTFDPGADFQDLADGETRDVTFTYTATDDSGAANDTSVAQTVTVTVTGTNDQPVASDVAINALEDGASVNGNFTVADTDVTDTHTFAITSTPSEGSVINNNDGSFTFDPGSDFQDLADGETRDVTFTYTATDDSGAANDTSVAQTVTVTVTGTNDQPVAGNVAINSVEDGASVNGNFTVADTDVTDTHTFAITSSPSEGSVVNNNDGTFTFDPGSDFQDLADGETRDVTFTYTATDDSGAANDTSVAQTVTVTVTGTNDQPVAGNVAINSVEDGATVNGNFTVTDADTTDTHTFAITSTPSEGSVINNNDGTFTFDPGADFQDLADGETRDVTFTYTATDDSGAANDNSVAQTVTVTVTGTNDQPVASDVAINALEDGATVNGNFAVTDADTTDTHTFAITSTPSEGSVINNNDGSFTFDPGSDFQDLADGETRDVTFTYTATDDSGAANDTSVAQTVTVTVTGTNDQPVASDVAINALEDGASVNGNFTVADADTTDTHTFAITSTPAEGSVVNNNDGSFTFDPGADFQDLADGETRDVTFTYTATDDSGAANDTSVAQTVTVTVTGTNDQPVAGNVAINSVEDGATVNGSFTVTDADTTDTHTFAITSAPAEGSVINNNDGTFTFDPGADFQDLADGETRDVTFTYTATDDSGAANDTSIAQTVTVTVTGTNDQPVASDVAINALEDGATVLGNFTVTDADTTDTHTFAITSTPAEGSVVNNNDGSFTFDPGADFQNLADGETRDVTFTYTATDDSGAANDTSVAQTVTVTVTGTNDQPVASDVAINALEDGASVNGNFTVADTDVTDTHTFAITSTPSEGSVINNNDGSFTFDPGSDFQDLADGETRDVTFTYTATDDSGAANDTSVAQTVTVTVTGTNDQPVAGNVAINSVEDGATVNGNFAVTDADTTDTHTFAITSAPAEGSVVNNNDGTFTFDPGSDFQDLADGETRDVTFTYTATDDSGAANDTSVVQTVTVTVTGTNDGPIIDLDANDSAAAGNNYAVTFTEGGSAAYIADTDINITDVDSTGLTGATITVNSVESGDLLTVGSIPAGITASAYDSVTGTITLSGSASLSDYQNAIRAIQFSNDGSTTNTTRSIDVVVTDGMNNSNTATTDVTINTLPTVSVTDVSVQEPATGTTTLTFTISIDQTLGSDLTFDFETADIMALAGADFVGISSTVGTIAAGADFTEVTVTINSDADVFEGDETLALNLTNFNQSVNFDAAAHIISGGVQGIGTIGANNGAPDAVDDSYITAVNTPLTITNALANDTLVDNAVVDVTAPGYTETPPGSGLYSIPNADGTVVYDSNTSSFSFAPNPLFTGTTSFDYTLIDDDLETSTASITIEVSATAPNPPVVSNVPDTAYMENDTPVSLVSGVNISDVDSSNLSSVVVTVDGYIGSQDVIDYLTAGTSVVASVDVSGSSWELTLTGGVDINEYETVLESITYENSSDNPSTSVRDITIEAFDLDYANLFGMDAGTLSITAVNDAPDVFDNNVFALDGSNGNPLNITIPTDPDTDDNLLVITITELPTSVGTVLLGVTPVSVGDTLTLTELAALQFDAGATPGQGTLTYDVFDGNLTTSATTTVNVGSTEADIGTVYESQLSNGTGVGGGSDTVTGNLFANDAAATPTSTIDNVNGIVPTGGVITINTAVGTLTVYADNPPPGFSTGDYVYVLNSADGSSNDVDEVFNYTFTEGVALSDTLTISVIDDVPVANDVVQDVPESEEQVFNVVLTLDISTSMNAQVGTTGQTRFELAKEALDALGKEYFNQSTQVEVTVLLFADGAHILGTFDNYTDFATNLTTVQDAGTGSYSNDLLVVNGGPGDPGGDNNATINDGTSYVDPTAMIEHVLTQDIFGPPGPGQLPADDVQNISYFLSDGAITRDTNTSLIGNGFDTFVNSNSVDSYAVGIGTGLPGDLSDLNYIHNIDALGQGSGQVDDALIVTDVAQLESELLSTVPTAFGGNITANGSVSNVLFGADSGYVQSFTTDIEGTPYTFSYDGSTVTVPAPLDTTVVVSGSTVELGTDDGFAFGTFTFDFSDGSYTLSAPNGLAPATFDFDYSIIDGDGDIASATATINIVDDAPDARDDLHSLSAFENAEGNVITALGTDGGPSFGVNFTPFTSQGGGVDKIVDDAVLSEFTYKGSLIDLNLTTSLGAPPIGGSENVSLTSQGAIDGAQFNLTGSATVTVNAGGIGVTGGANANLNTGELLTVDFLGKGLLDYGVDNLVLTISDYQSNNTDTVTITVYDTVGATLGTIVQTATTGGNETVDLSAFSGVGSIDIAETGGGTDIQVLNIAYDPAPATEVLDQTGGNNGSNLSWIYSYETDLDGNPVYQATVTDSNDGSVFIMSSNGYYNYTPDSSGLSLTPEAVSTTDPVIVAASDLTLSGFDNAGNLATLIYTGNGVTVQGGWSNDRIDLGEMVTIDFTTKGGNPYGVQNVVFNLTSAGASETVTYIIYGLDGTTVLGTENSSADPFTISSTDYPQIGKIDFIADGATYVRILDIAYDQLDNALPTELGPVLVDYVLTDTDGQSDTAQLALYTIDQTITGTSGMDNIAGGSLNDAIIGDDGDDILSGNAGNDSLSGGAGDDTLSGGVGNDYLSGGDGQDNLSGGAGSDTLDGGAGDDLVDGSSGDDVVLGGAGDDLVFGGSGDDRLEGGDGDDVLTGGSGNDVIFGDAGDDRLIGGSGDDSLIGGDGIDIFALESGDEGTDLNPAVDTIADFTLGMGGDVLDLSDMLVDEEIGPLVDYMSFNYNGGTGDTTISIDIDGSSGGSGTVQEIVLSGVDLTAGGTFSSDQQILDNLLSNGNLIVDQ